MLPTMEIALVLVGLVALIAVLATAYLARRLLRAAVLFTYLGVNLWISGLHSYAGV